MTVLEINTKPVFKERIKKPRNLPISLKTFFLSLQFTVGHDLGFSVLINKKMRFLGICFSRVVTLVFIGIFIIPVINHDTPQRLIWGLLGFTQVIGHVIALHSVKYKPYHFVMDIRKIDITNMWYKERTAGILASGCYLSIFVSRFLGSYTVCFYKIDQCMFDIFPFSVVYCTLLGCLESLCIVQVLIYYYVYCAFKYVKYLTDNPNAILDDIRNQFTYIADCCDKIQPLYGNLVSDLLM